MRRFFSRAVVARSAAVILIAGLPGFVPLAALPASAQTTWDGEVVSVQGTAVVPKQQRGAAGVLPSLTVTPATATAATAEDDPPVRGALPEDGGAWPRMALKAEPETESQLPAGVQRAEQQDQATAANTFPLIDDVYPDAGSLVGTTTPLLTVRATRINEPDDPFSPLNHTYHICEKPEEDEEDTGSPSSTPPCWKSGALPDEDTWRVPAGKLEWGKQYEWWVRIVDSESKAVATSDKQLILMGARQPINSAQLGERVNEEQEFSLLGGNYTTTEVDAHVQVAGPALTVQRTYNSSDSRTNGIFGAGWSTAWDMNVVAERSGTAVTGLLVTYADGRRVRFAAKGDGGYQPPPGTKDTLADADGGGWRLKDTASMSYVFNAAGRLLKIEDNRGRAQTLNYNADGTFDTVTGAGGRALHVTWNGPRVATVSTDPVDGKALTWTYTYTGDNLTSVCTPAAAPNCTTYSYGDGSRYKGLVLDSEPVGYWRLGDKQHEPAANLGSDGGTGQYDNVTVGQPGALEGTADTAAGFTKSTMMLPVPMLDRLRDQVSLEGWIKTTQPGVIFSADESGSGVGASLPVLYVGTDGKLRGQLGLVDGEYTPIISAGTVTDDRWHHVVLTVAGDKQKLYLDGQVVGELTGPLWDELRQYAFVGSGDRASSWSSVPGGPRASGVWPFKGSIDEFAVYGKPLTDTEVQSHWSARTKISHKLSQVTLPSGRVRAKNTYHPATDRLDSHTDRHGGTWKLGDFDIDWDEGLYKIALTDPRGGTLDYAYDTLRNARPTYTIDQAGAKTSYDYDTGGFKVKLTDPNGNVIQRWNDKRGNIIQGKSCRKAGNCQRFYLDYHANADDDFDPLNDKLKVFRDARSTDAASNTYATTFEYNSYGEPTKQSTPATPDFPEGRSNKVTYTDGSEPAVGGGTTPPGLEKTRTDPRGNTWSYAYTAAGDLAEQTDPLGLVTKLGYDEIGRVTSTTKVSEANPNGVTTSTTYDPTGRVATVTGAAVKNEVTGVTHTARTTYGYDPDGNKLSESITDLTGGDAERKTVHSYDDFGQLASTTDPEGGVTRQTWDASGLKATSTDARGTLFVYGYSKRGELTTTTLKGWTGSPVDPQLAKDVVLESRSYDSGGRLAAQVDAMGRKTSYTYFGDDLLSEKIGDDVRLNSSSETTDVVLEANSYDAAGNLVQQVTGGNKKMTTVSSYDAANRLSSQTLDPAGLNRKTSFTYDANDNIIKSTLTAAGTARAETKEFAYNKVNKPTRHSVENGDRDIVSTTTYDDRGLPVAATDPRGNADGANAADYTTTLRYDVLDRLVETKAPQVQVDKNGAASTTRPSALMGYDTVGNQTHERDAEGGVLTSTFDRVSRLTRASAPAYTPPGGSAITSAVQHAYDKAGQRVRTTDPRGYLTSYEYDQLGRQVRVTDPAPDGQNPGTRVAEYDMAGQQLFSVDATGTRTGATYDDLGRKITATQIERKPSSAVYTTTMEYDQAGRLTKQTAPGSVVTSYTYNAAGETETVTDLGTNVAMTYDLAGRLVKTTDALRNATIAEYDLAGRKNAAKDVDSAGTVLRTYGYGYDLAGNPTSTTSPEGHVTKQVFDALGRTTSLIEPVSDSESITTSFGYDATGARTRLTDGRGNATWTSYNSLGLAETVTEPPTKTHPDAADRTWTHLYDAAGNQTATIQPGGVRTDRTYDHLNRLTKESGAGGDAATAERTFGYDLAGRSTTAGDLTVDYNDRGLPLKIMRGTVQETAYAYDGLGNPTQRIDAAGSAVFTYDTANRLKTATDPVTSRTLTYDYDTVSRLKTITATSGTASTQTIDYDNLDRITGQTLKNGSGSQLAKITYGWDKDDNLTTKTTAGTAGAGTNSYSYDHAGRLTSWTAPGGAITAYEWDAAGNRTKAGDKTFTYDERNRLTSGDGTDYTYTPRGTMATSTKAGATTQYTFDAFDRLIADGDSLYAYDALDRVTSRISGTTKQTHQYAGLGNDLAAISVSSSVQAKYSRDPFGALVGLQEGTAPAAATLSDLHSDLVATYTGTGLVSSTSYGPFGETAAQAGDPTSLGYQGEYTDPDTGKVNMHARWYQPGTGTFTSRDTWTLEPTPSVQANRYTYANASPLTGTDPTGHTVLNDIDGGMGDRGNHCSMYGDCNGQWVPDVGFNPGFNEEEARRINVVHEGLGAGRDVPADDFWLNNSKEGEAARRKYIDLYDPMNPNINEDELWEYAKVSTRATACDGCGVKAASAVGCEVLYGAKSCKAMKKAAKLVGDAKVYYDNCLNGDGSQDGHLAGSCRGIAKRLGIGYDEWLALKKLQAEARDKSGSWFIRLFRGISDFIWGDAQSCNSGSGISCFLMVANLLPGGAAVKAVGKLAKYMPKLAQALRSGAAAAACNSFRGETLVLMADGGHKAIEDVQVGDRVVATDPVSGQTEAKQVADKIFGIGTKHLVQISVRLESENEAAETSVVATAGHPFWVPSLREWVDATYLRPGLWLRTSSGTWIQVATVKRWTTEEAVYNLSVADIHTYYVAIGSADALVHNDQVVPNIIKQMLRDIQNGSLMQRTTYNKKTKQYELDFYKNREGVRRNEFWVDGEIFGYDGNNDYRIIRKGDKYAWVGPKGNKPGGGHNYGKIIQIGCD
ncbi:polymorphic toxin-type HINT domain-containing protein [Nonomuraea sp. NPDC050404]|uniref:polymorphic toxin-type HINT domain-containing protein n=1 Tax=Nonomuraea sp. NPDC050404 TaxID=3155783 RepID=UPI0033CFC1C6